MLNAHPFIDNTCLVHRICSVILMPCILDVFDRFSTSPKINIECNYDASSSKHTLLILCFANRQ
jgi:hypothetical protein